MAKDFEIVQVIERHRTNGNEEAEIVIRDKHSFLVYSGILKKVESSKKHYPPDYFKKHIHYTNKQ